jgi:hypothetical protein
MNIKNLLTTFKNKSKGILDNSAKIFFTQKSSKYRKISNVEEELKRETEALNEIIYNQTINPDSKIFTNLNIDNNRECSNEPGIQKKFSDVDRESESEMIAGQMQTTQADEILEKEGENKNKK